MLWKVSSNQLADSEVSEIVPAAVSKNPAGGSRNYICFWKSSIQLLFAKHFSFTSFHFAIVDFEGVFLGQPGPYFVVKFSLFILLISFARGSSYLSIEKIAFVLISSCCTSISITIIIEIEVLLRVEWTGATAADKDFAATGDAIRAIATGLEKSPWAGLESTRVLAAWLCASSLHQLCLSGYFSVWKDLCQDHFRVSRNIILYNCFYAWMLHIGFSL